MITEEHNKLIKFSIFFAILFIFLYLLASNFLFQYKIEKNIISYSNLLDSSYMELQFCKSHFNETYCYKNFLEEVEDLGDELSNAISQTGNQMLDDPLVFSFFKKEYLIILKSYENLKNKNNTVLYIFSTEEYCPICAKATLFIRKNFKDYLVFPINIYFLKDTSFLKYLRENKILYLPTFIINGTKRIGGLNNIKYPIPTNFFLKTIYKLSLNKSSCKIFYILSILFVIISIVLAIYRKIIISAFLFAISLFLFFMSYFFKPFYFFYNIATYVTSGKFIFSLGRLGNLFNNNSPISTIFFGLLWFLFRENMFIAYFIISSLILTIFGIAILKEFYKLFNRKFLISLIFTIITFGFSTKIHHLIYFPELLIIIGFLGLYLLTNDEILLYFIPLTYPKSIFIILLYLFANKKIDQSINVTLVFLITSYLISGGYLTYFNKILVSLVIFVFALVYYIIAKKFDDVDFALFLVLDVGLDIYINSYQDYWLITVIFPLFIIEILKYMKSTFSKISHSKVTYFANFFIIFSIFISIANIINLSTLEHYSYWNTGIDLNYKYLFEKVFQYFADKKYYLSNIATDNAYFASLADIKLIPLNLIKNIEDLKKYKVSYVASKNNLNISCLRKIDEIGFKDYRYIIYKNECKRKS